MKPKRLAVIQFPGSNCEYETAYAAESFGFAVDIVRWNVEKTQISGYDAYILPGGFSFQDRIRAGVISSKLPVMQYLKEEADLGKVILGICNGCQILSEAGFFPNQAGSYQVEVAMAPNTQQSKPIGFICDWVYVRVKNPQKSAFTRPFSEADIIPIPINHGEGRFILKESQLETFSKHTYFQYCTEDGQILDDVRVNPNGSSFNLAGLCNEQGNILGIMPHPERASFTKQIPTWLHSPWGKNSAGPWSGLFLSMIAYLNERPCPL